MVRIDSSESNLEKKKHMSTWSVDSGCLRHMTGNKELLSNYKEKLKGSVTFVDDRKGQIKGYGVIVKGEVGINKVAYVNGLKHNLISVTQLCDKWLRCQV